MTPEICSVAVRRSGMAAFMWGFIFATGNWDWEASFRKPILRQFGCRKGAWGGSCVSIHVAGLWGQSEGLW
jgi:hypothetical protein